MRFSGASRRGKATGSNEDWYAIAPGLLVLLDGATTRTETGCRHGAAWYVRQLGARLVTEASDRSVALDTALATAIRQVAALHPECDLQHPGSPSAAVAIVRFDSEDTAANYLVLGDITLVVQTQTDLFTLTDQRVSATAPTERQFADQFLIGTPEKSAALIRMKYAELAAKNTPGGYWVAGADPRAVSESIMGHLDLRELRQIAALSDGAARLVDTFHLADWSDALALLQAEGPAGLIHQVRTAELEDQFGKSFPRNKASDDATALHFVRVWDSCPHDEEMEIAVTDDRQRAIRSIVERFQDNPNIMGAEPPYRDTDGVPCTAERSPYWSTLREYVQTP